MRKTQSSITAKAEILQKSITNLYIIKLIENTLIHQSLYSIHMFISKPISI